MTMGLESEEVRCFTSSKSEMFQCLYMYNTDMIVLLQNDSDSNDTDDDI